MRGTPIRFVRNIGLANAFHSVLGLAQNTAATGGTWADLHGAVALHFSTDEKLEITVDRLRAAGYEPSDVDETFGRFITVSDPDGYLVQVNEMDEDLQNISYEIRESAAMK